MPRLAQHLHRGRIAVFGAATPPRLTGLSLWLRADLGITFSVDPAVSAWADQSGMGHHFAQGTLANQPTLLPTGGPGGLPALSFVYAIGQWLDGPVLSTLFTATARTVYVVFRATSVLTAFADALAYLNHAVVQDSSGDFGVTLRSTPEVLANNFDGTNDVAASPLTVGAWTVHEHRLDSGTLYGRTHDSAEVSTVSGATAGITGICRVGYGFATVYDGRVAEVLMYNRALSATERLQVRGYLSTRYGIAMVPP